MQVVHTGALVLHGMPLSVVAKCSIQLRDDDILGKDHVSIFLNFSVLMTSPTDHVCKTKQESPADADKPARLKMMQNIAPIRRVSFHFTEFHFTKFQITNA